MFLVFFFLCIFLRVSAFYLCLAAACRLGMQVMEREKAMETRYTLIRDPLTGLLGLSKRGSHSQILGIRVGARQLRAQQPGGADKPQELPKIMREQS